MNFHADQEFCAALVLALGHFLWQGTLIAGLAVLATRHLRSARHRYLLLMAGFCLMAASPGITLVARGLSSDPGRMQTAVVPPAAVAEGSQVSHPALPLNLSSSDSKPQTSEALVAPLPTSSVESTAEPVWPRFAPLLTNFYLLGVAAMLLRLVVGLWGGWQLHRRSIPVTDIALLQALRRQAASLGLKVVPVLAYCERVAVPTVIGILKPTILLPLMFTSGLDAKQVEAVLAHELAHVRRYDHLVNLLQRVVESLLFFHPAVWWLSHRIRVEREHCCDDLVVGCGAVPLAYAKSLLRVAELSRLSRSNRAASVVSLLATGQPSTLRQRIARLLGEASETHVRFLHRWPVILLAMVCVLVSWTTTRVGWGLSAPADKVVPYIAEFPDGTTVELLSIGYHQTQRKKCWAADGTELPAEPHDPQLARVEFSSFKAGSLQSEAREIAVRITGIPKQETHFGYQFCQESSGDAVSNAVVYGPSEFTSASMPLASELKNKQISLRVCIDPLPEEIVRAISTDGQKLGGEPLTEVLRRADALVQPVRVEKVQDQTELLLKPVNRAAAPPTSEWVPVAIDKVGGRHESIRGGSRDGLFTYRYPVALAEIARFEYRLKPYRHWVTFSNLSVQPGEKTKVQVTVESLSGPVPKPQEKAANSETVAGAPPATQPVVRVDAGRDNLIQPVRKSDPQAVELAQRAHQRAAALTLLPDVFYRVKQTNEEVHTVKVAAATTIDANLQTLQKPFSPKAYHHETTFAYSPNRFFSENYYSNKEGTEWFSQYRTWTRNDAWNRSSQNSKPFFVHQGSPDSMWEYVTLFEFGYLRQTPRKFWWGEMLHNDQHISDFDPAQATWLMGPAEEFAGEMCDVVISPERRERLWIGRQNGHVRGIAAYRVQDWQFDKLIKSNEIGRIAGRKFESQREYSEWYQTTATKQQHRDLSQAWAVFLAADFPNNAKLNELIRFDDYREVQPSVWVPFHETRSVPRFTDNSGNQTMLKLELTVEELRFDADLDALWQKLEPQPGDRVQDQRFHEVAVDIKYGELSDNQIRDLAAAERTKREGNQKLVDKATEPFHAMIGKPAPQLSPEGWIGDRPELAGQPYLIHFWATWCTPCKNDFELLKVIAEKRTVIGIHPHESAIKDIKDVIEQYKLNYPTLVDKKAAQVTENRLISGYPHAVLPYCVLVGADGKVIAHGSLNAGIMKKWPEKVPAAK